MVVMEGEMLGSGWQQDQLVHTAPCVLSLQTLRNRLAHIPCHKYYPLITQG